MNQEQAKAWLPLVKAVAEGKELQMEKEHYQGNLPDFREWFDIDFDYLLHRFNRGEVRFDCVRIKPKKFKNFELPWDFIDKRWNFATYTTCNGGANGGVILYESKPEFIGGTPFTTGWSSMDKPCTWMALEIKQEGINEADWLACRNPEGIEVQS